jgi:hypothetical protein
MPADQALPRLAVGRRVRHVLEVTLLGFESCRHLICWNAIRVYVLPATHARVQPHHRPGCHADLFHVPSLPLRGSLRQGAPRWVNTRGHPTCQNDRLTADER